MKIKPNAVADIGTKCGTQATSAKCKAFAVLKNKCQNTCGVCKGGK